MAKRKKLDWEAIEKLYRADQLSIREIAKQHGCSDKAVRNNAKKFKWDRNLSARIKAKVENDLVRAQVREEVRTADTLTDSEIVESAASIAVEVVRGHQKRLSTGGKAVEVLLDQLVEVAKNREEIEETIKEETTEDINLKRRVMMLRAVSLQSNASIAVSLSAALKNLIMLEREVFNIGSGMAEEKLDEIELIAVYPK